MGSLLKGREKKTEQYHRRNDDLRVFRSFLA